MGETVMSGPWEDYGGGAPWEDYAKQAPKAKPAAPDQTDWLERLSQGYTDPMIGMAQIVAKGLNAVGVKTPIDSGFKAEEEAYQARRGDNAGSFDGMRTIGNIVNPATVMITSKLGPLTGGASAAAMQPVIEGDFLTEKAKQAAIGGASGYVGGKLSNGLARVISPKASVNPDLALLKKEGISPTIGQTLGGLWNKAEEQAMSIPILGGGIANARGRALDQFNNAAINRALAPIGQKAEGTGFDAISRASGALSDVYENSLGRIGATQLDDGFAAIANAAKAEVMDLPKVFQTRFNRLFDSPGKRFVTETGEISAENAKAVMSDIGKEIRKFSNSSDVSTTHYVDQLTAIQEGLKNVLKQKNPTYAKAVANADQGWANLVRIENAANRAVNNGGVFTPGQLNMAVRGTDSSVRKNATAHGDALMQDLSNAAQSVIGNKVPDSGTAGRSMLSLLMGGAPLGMFAPAALMPTLGGLLGGRALYSQPAQKVLTGAVSARPDAAPAVAELLKLYGNAAAPLLGIATANGYR